MEKIWVYGTGGHAAVIVDMILSMKVFDIAGFVDDDINKKDKIFYKHAKIYSPAEFVRMNQKFNIKNILFAIGSNEIRKKLTEQFSVLNFPTIIHPTAIIGKFVEIDSGTVVMPYTVIETEAKVGKHCIINNNAIIGHNSVIGDYCHVGGRVILSGGTKVGHCCLIGIGASVTPLTTIGNQCTVGAGSVIAKDVPDNSFMFGNPARKVSNFLTNC